MRVSRSLLLALLALPGASQLACGGDDRPDRGECVGDRCEPQTGEVGQACFANRTCLAGARCAAGVCEPCELGAEGCACFANQSCARGQCLMGTCTGPAGFVQPIPSDPVCYTPCRGSFLLPDGAPAECSRDGLYAGCVGDNVCDQGTCVPAALAGARALEAGSACVLDADCGRNAAGEELICVNGACAVLEGVSTGVCASDAECPDFQVCILGRCFANCGTDGDCPSPARCHLRACRLPCLSTGGPCPEGSECSTVDGTSGYCMPTMSPGSVSTPPVATGSFAVLSDATLRTPATTLQFTNVNTEASLVIENQTSARQTFTVRKVQHIEPSPTGGAGRVITEQPLYWLRMGVAGDDALTSGETLELVIDPQERATLRLLEAGNPEFLSWTGELEVSHPRLGSQRITLSYRSSPGGRWAGKMYFFTSFPTTGLEAWAQLPRSQQLSPSSANQVKNAFMQQWVGFKRGDNFTVDRLLALLQSTQVESYDWPLLREYCPEPLRRCYPFDNTQGFLEYTSNVQEFPIPRGLTELPFAVELGPDPSVGANGFSGRILTEQALHYGGDPRVELAFETDPTECPTNVAGTTLCQLTRFQADLAVGGRYFPAADQTSCAGPAGREGYELFRTPWLVPGFLEGTQLDATGVPVRRECRDTRLPFGPELREENALLALSNPIPDGRTRRRRLDMLDAALVDSRTLVVLFREEVPSFLGTSDSSFSGLGFMLLTRAPGEATAVSSGSVQSDPREQTPDLLFTECSAELRQQALGRTTAPSTAAELARLAGYALGEPPAGNPPTVLPSQGEVPHYLCVDSGQFDAAPDNGAGAGNGQPTPCPDGSRVVYFTLRNYPGVLAADSCNHGYRDEYQIELLPNGRSVTNRVVTSRGTCEARLPDLLAQYDGRLNPVWRCTDGPDSTPRAYCDDSRSNLLQGKIFYAAPDASQGPLLLPIDTAVDEGFRYRTRFVSRSGRNTGFAPVICGIGTEYCYDPEEIEAARARMDCLVDLYVNGYATLAQAAAQGGPDGAEARLTLDRLRAALRLDFSYVVNTNPVTGVTETKNGFERLYAELLIMLGDDAYTSAFASRFDLAGSSLRTFRGRDFEGNEGIDLTGGAGFEMYTLYQAVQYYDLALERFYRLAPTLWRSLALPAGAGFVTSETVQAYFSRVFRASTQKAAALAEIARRYQGFNKTELAKRVALRAYTAAYLEAMVASNVLSKLRAGAATQDGPQIEAALTEAARRYRAALLDMTDLYAELSVRGGASFFGFAPEYVPFPALDTVDLNAVDKIFSVLRDKMALAAEKERIALTSQRDFDTDAAAFQAELTQIRLNYEGQIADACGTFVGADGQTYPATARFAHLSERAASLGDPCGLLGSGAVYEALVEAGLAQLELRRALQEQDNVLARIQIEQRRVEDLCDAIEYTASHVEGQQNRIRALNNGIRSAENIKEVAYGALDVAATLADLASCGATNGQCAAAAISSTAYLGVAIGVAATVVATNISVQVLEDQKEKLEIALGKWETERECTYAEIESNALVRSLWLDLSVAGIEVVKALEGLKLASARVVRERNAAQRLIQEQEETEQLAIDVQAARNDPNARIYKNDDVLTADRTFKAAVREAYKATKVFEYYTSQSYARRDNLFLVRLVERGDLSLETYVGDLEQAYLEFGERYGNPDTRVLVVSMRDDVLRIPRVNARTGAALREADRVAIFRRALRDPRWLDPRGYASFDFPVELDALSPLTRNHKVYFTEAEFIGSDTGDAVGRVYLSSRGTGTVRSVSGDKVFYALPPRTAVMNTFFNGYRDFYDNTRISDVYANFRLRELPVANSKWQLVLNLKDERVNQDINLDSLSDIRIYLYYRDFTEL